MLIQPAHVATELSVADYIIAGIVVAKQMQRFRELHIVIDDEGNYDVKMVVRVSKHVDDNGALGVPIPSGEGIEARYQPLHANNDSAVDLDTGLVTHNRDGRTWPEWLAFLQAAPGNHILQGDYYEQAFLHQQVQMQDMCLAMMEAANHPPYDKFSAKA